MRKTLLAGTAAVMLVTSQLPAQAAAQAAPTDLQLSWSETAQGQIQVRWNDNGEANRVYRQYDDSDDLMLLARSGAAGTNEKLVLTDFFDAKRTSRILVTTVDAAGVESPAINSAWFDSLRPTAPVLTNADPLPDQSLRLRWTQAATPADTTPGDPLDRPSSESTVGPVIWWTEADAAKTEFFLKPAGTTSAAVPPRPRPYPISVIGSNEWGTTRASTSVTFATMALTFAVPATNEFGRGMWMTGVVGAQDCGPTLPTCRKNYPVSMTLQTRADATKPWSYFGRYVEDGQYQTLANALGSQQYRMTVPSWKYLDDSHWTVTAPVSTSARYSATKTRFFTAWFNKRSATVGQVVKLAVWIKPEATVRADLQWWDGKVWHHGAYVQLVKGKGALNVKASGRGTTRSWRVLVPKMSYYGKPIEATGSRAFKLAVS
ncbi:hypothetical protein GCM10009554_32910 [Kribbella koreensis]|uniref:Fibronectin type-III domain-containing protein n=1 Tax=Kribbella koreensis TaxID=57909 RepID=A0ABN1QF15_9ACTN